MTNDTFWSFWVATRVKVWPLSLGWILTLHTCIAAGGWILASLDIRSPKGKALWGELLHTRLASKGD